MKISIDPVISSRIRQAWAKLTPEQQNRIAPLIAKANQQALIVSQARMAPTPDPAIGHQALLAHSALTGDQDAVVHSLEAGVVIDVGPDGVIWGTGRYQNLDPGWAEATAVWLEHLIVGKHAFNNTPATIPIPDAVQIGMAGDWGTGDWRTAANPAPATDVRIHLAFLQPNLTIHLGDVYYAGTADQESHLLVNLWPSGPLGALALNSNHEMYPGGDAYFQQALGSPLFKLQQGCSFFALENENWVIVGLDSAYYSNEEGLYEDGSLYPASGPQVQLDFLRAQAAKNKKVIVLTHHNALSLDGLTPNNLWGQVMSAFPPESGPAYWYWGHAHAGAVYVPQGPANNVLCRCNGHGALPWGQASQLANSKNVLWYEHRSANDTDIPQRVLNGFAMLYFEGPNLQEVFYDENGGIAWHS